MPPLGGHLDLPLSVCTSIKVFSKHIFKSTGAKAFKAYRDIIQDVRLRSWDIADCQIVFDQSYLPIKRIVFCDIYKSLWQAYLQKYWSKSHKNLQDVKLCTLDFRQLPKCFGLELSALEKDLVFMPPKGGI